DAGEQPDAGALSDAIAESDARSEGDIADELDAVDQVDGRTEEDASDKDDSTDESDATEETDIWDSGDEEDINPTNKCPQAVATAMIKGAQNGVPATELTALPLATVQFMAHKASTLTGRSSAMSGLFCPGRRARLLCCRGTIARMLSFF